MGYTSYAVKKGSEREAIEQYDSLYWAIEDSLDLWPEDPNSDISIEADDGVVLCEMRHVPTKGSDICAVTIRYGNGVRKTHLYRVTYKPVRWSDGDRVGADVECLSRAADENTRRDAKPIIYKTVGACERPKGTRWRLEEDDKGFLYLTINDKPRQKIRPGYLFLATATWREEFRDKGVPEDVIERMIKQSEF